jgi:hypothetical protein
MCGGFVSKVIGHRLPSQIQQVFDGEDLADKIGPAYLLMTTDDDGTPRPCMLSAGEIFVCDDRRIRIAVWPGSTSSKNLDRNQRVLLCFVAPGTVFYVKGRSRSLGKGASTQLQRFELNVDTVESDTHAGMPVGSPITFALEDDGPAQVVASWKRQIDDLKA